MKIPTYACEANLSRAVYMAANSAGIITLASSVPLASMYMVVQVGTCTIAALKRGWPLFSEPSVYTYSFG